MNNKKIKIIFYGSKDFSVPILLDLIEEYDVVGIVTEQDKVAGRGKQIQEPPVKKIAMKFDIPFWQPKSVKNNSVLAKELDELDSDLAVVASYGKLIPPNLLNIPKKGSINVHPSSLPKYRGSSPIQFALLNGDSQTGTTIIVMDEGMDSGEILAQEKLVIEETDNYQLLSEKLTDLSSELLKNVISDYVNEKAILQSQVDSDATFTRKIEKQDGKIDWQLDCQDILNMIKAYSSWPGTYTYFNDKKLDIKKAAVADIQIEEDASVGQVVKSEKRYFVKCADCYLELLEVQLEGKQVVKISDFVNGHQNFVGSVLS
ncbi:methionyl-tRNA formyltransferase [Candidatus Falkowbacteria bacterium]|nr:methionyl-tRNA formyltransferase [Candidatus Falkowbacteria bacterium]